MGKKKAGANQPSTVFSCLNLQHATKSNLAESERRKLHFNFKAKSYLIHHKLQSLLRPIYCLAEAIQAFCSLP